MKKYYGLFTILMIIFLNACSSKTHKAMDIYTLKYNAIPSTKPLIATSNKTLKIIQPQSSKEIQKKKILYAKTLQQRETYAYSRWSDTPNRMLEDFLVAYLNQTALFKVVIPHTSQVAPAWLLESNIEDFYQYFDEENRAFAIVKIRFFLMDKKDKSLISQYYFSAKIPSSPLDAKGGVLAFNLAMQQVATELQLWLKDLKILTVS